MISLAYICHIFGISLAYIWHIFGISLVYVWLMFGITLANLLHIVGISLAYICNHCLYDYSIGLGSLKLSSISSFIYVSPNFTTLANIYSDSIEYFSSHIIFPSLLFSSRHIVLCCYCKCGENEYCSTRFKTI